VTSDFITVVSGVPRSGTSLMMQMLEAGGMPILTDRIRTANDDNPLGYYEYEPVKALSKGQAEWLPLAQGKVVKVITALLEYLPVGYDYRLVMMHRQMDEVVVSQRRMLEHRGEPQTAATDDKLADMLARHLAKVEGWLARQPNFTRVTVDYNQLVADPLPPVLAVNQLLGGRLDTERMCAVVQPSLYRNRSRNDRP
jgi:hypothetical protein